MNEIILIIIAIVLFFFGFEIRPWIVTKYPENRHVMDLMAMAVTITTILIHLISLIVSGTSVIGSYIIVVALLIIYLIYYGVKHRKELNEKSRKVFVELLALYVYIFIVSVVLLIWVAPHIQNVKL